MSIDGGRVSVTQRLQCTWKTLFFIRIYFIRG